MENAPTNTPKIKITDSRFLPIFIKLIIKVTSTNQQITINKLYRILKGSVDDLTQHKSPE